MSVGKQAGKGFISYLFRNVLEKLMGLIAMIFLARKLTPYDFGLVSITEVLLYLISVLGTTGLAEFLLAYRKDDTEEIFKSAFWFNAVITVGVVVLFLVSVPFWSVFQQDKRIAEIGFVVIGIFIFSQLQIIPKTWLSKNLQFDKQVKIQAPFIILIPLAKIAAVFAGLGVYSLIVPTLIFQPLLTLFLYRGTSLKLNFKLYTNRWQEIYHFTKHLIGATIFTRITDQGDKFILAKFLGIDKLGIYNIAFQLAELFTSQLSQISNNVLSSVLPKYVDDKDKFYSYYIGFLKAFSFLTLPMLAIMFIAAKPIVLSLYGSKWLEAVLPLQILTVTAAFKAVSSSYGCVMNSFHLNKKSFIVTTVYGPVHLAASAFGAMFGLAGLAMAVSVVKVLFINWNIRQVMQAVSRPFIKWYQDITPFFAVNIICAVAISMVMYFLPVNTSSIISISFTATSFIVLYILFLKIVFKKQMTIIGGIITITFPKAAPYFNRLFNL